MDATTLAVLWGLAGFIVGALLTTIAWSVWVDKLRQKSAKTALELQYEREARAADRAQEGRLQAERERTLKATVEGLLAQVTEVANAALKSREQELAMKNRQLLEPLSAQINALQKESVDSKAKISTKLDVFFNSLQETASQFGKEARAFREVMRGANKKQGTWGENILKALLDSFGLEEGRHYLLQTSVQGKIPDALIIDHVGERILIVDSKMSWTNYAAAYEMEEGTAREAELKKHAQSVRLHIQELAEKDYPSMPAPAAFANYQYVPLTAMFVPCEAALETALQVDPALMDFAFKKQVVLVTPHTLLGFLVLISRAWSQFQIERNTREIIHEASLLVSRVDALFDALEQADSQMVKSHESLAKALQLANTQGSGQSVKGPINRILQLGARAEKKLKSKALTELV